MAGPPLVSHFHVLSDEAYEKHDEACPEATGDYDRRYYFSATSKK
jgi:hypothetical protein